LRRCFLMLLHRAAPARPLTLATSPRAGGGDQLLDLVNYLTKDGSQELPGGPSMAVSTDLDRRVGAVRRFNRFYVRQIGVLGEALLDSPFTLTQARVLYELAHRKHPTASDLVTDLGLDAGYLSRLLRNFEKQGLLARSTSSEDGRQRYLTLTSQGHKAFNSLDRDTRRQIASLLQPLSESQQDQVESAMQQIEGLLGHGIADGDATVSGAYHLRPPRPGDMGWVVHRHGALYAAEYGWNENFEALAAEIVANFVKNFDPARERCWIAERDGQILGSIFLMRQSATVAKLRMLLVEPNARGMGLRLVKECIDFARKIGYRRMHLWTTSNLTAARHLYVEAGFRLIESEPHREFGQDLISETWELTL
jgi:DNA-binding MarR family transcriptional regulator/N-acetylglutamate synthase-like GNAT family acetyltransferase